MASNQFLNSDTRDDTETRRVLNKATLSLKQSSPALYGNQNEQIILAITDKHYKRIQNPSRNHIHKYAQAHMAS